MHIGLLEDNPAIQDYLRQALEMSGHSVSIHTFGISLLDALFAEKPDAASYPHDLLIVDLNLPGDLSGHDVILHIRKAVPPKLLPMLIISGAEQSRLEQVHTLFADIPFIQKPFRLQTLLQMLETIEDKQ
jgi:DNA-binding response OmpR family regulator